MKHLLYGDVRPYCNRTTNFIIRLFENRNRYPMSIGYAWGDHIDTGIRLPTPDTTIIRALRIKTELLVKVSYPSDESITAQDVQTPCIVRGSASYGHRLHLRDPCKVVNANSAIKIQSGSHAMEISVDTTDWIKTLTFLAPLIS